MTQSVDQPTASTITKCHVIGEVVYAKWRYPDKDEHWYEAYFVEKITEKRVYVRGFMEPTAIVVSRRSFERNGFAVSLSHATVFYVAMPEDYRRQTIGYLMDEAPRKTLGLGESFTSDQLKTAYRKRASETHPDRGGDPQEFMAVQTAYERLSRKQPRTLGEVLDYAKEAVQNAKSEQAA